MVAPRLPGRLFIVSTPIGHLGDFSFRAVEVLGRVSVVAAEDTRRTRRLLAHYRLSPCLLSLHAHSRPAATERLLDRVAVGEDVAYVTDAGTPAVSDPGARLAQRAHQRGLPVVPIPGPAAVVTALQAAGFPADRFVFLGFLPRRGAARVASLERVAAEAWTCVCYEAPGRTVALLRDLAERCGPGRPAAVARELTKLHEEVRRGTLGELAAYYGERPPRGEVTVVVAGRAERTPRTLVGGPRAGAPAEAGGIIAALRAEGRAPGAIARELARRLGLTRHEAYRLLHRS